MGLYCGFAICPSSYPWWYFWCSSRNDFHDKTCSDKLGLSLELGSFAAGLMISTTDLAHHTLEQ
ncbi:hypothetical protein OROHE_025294 [Orobanche hederae]